MNKQTLAQKNQILSILEQVYGGIGPALRFGSPWQLLVAVVLSAQTNDNQVNRITESLFRDYPDAASLATLTPAQLEPLISTCGLYRNKARNLVATARLVSEHYGGQPPRSREELTALPGVGNKSANVILSVGYGLPALAVDTHVQRVANRLGLAVSKTPDQTEAQLCALIPREKWSAAHHWLIWHGRRLCAARKPRCPECPLLQLCPSAEAFTK